jgi:Ubiquinol-cytochrome C reductase complex 14kD subunit
VSRDFVGAMKGWNLSGSLRVGEWSTAFEVVDFRSLKLKFVSPLFFCIGLRYEDIMSRDEPEVNEALELAHPDVVEGRYRRLKRASDLAFKQKNLQDYAPNMTLEPYKLEISHDVEKILQRDVEFDLLNNYKSG